MPNDNSFAGLYFPFSRPLEVEAVKQMMLVFDSIGFFDPVDNDQWRRKLLLDLKAHQGEIFNEYKNLDAALPMLLEEEAIKKYSPDILTNGDHLLASAATLSDLNDARWVEFANRPQNFGMPHSIAEDGQTPTWFAFRPKLPNDFIDGLEASADLCDRHLFVNGGDRYAWTLSYAAGSSIATNIHLAAAEKLNLAPVTDSPLHHRLLVSKAANRAAEADIFNVEEAERDLSGIVTSMVLKSLVPQTSLKDVSFEQILRFRQETREIRHAAITEISRITRSQAQPANARELLSICREIETGLLLGLQEYRNEMTSVRDKFWPKLVEAPEKNLAAGGLAALALSYVGVPGGLLIGSLAAAGLSLLKSGFDVRAERQRIVRSKSPTVAFLSKLQSFS